MKFYAIELSPDGHEVLFDFEATSNLTAQAVADLIVFTTMAECHHSYWMSAGRVVKASEYDRNGGFYE